MNSRESLQGASGLGLDPTAGSVLVKTPVASRREISGKLISRPLRFLYWVYEQWLLRQLQEGSMPRHIGIILDGNRRHARRRGTGDPREIYQLGANKLDDALNWCAELGIGAVTLWVFSTERLLRCPGSSQQSRPKSRRWLMILSCIKNAFVSGRSADSIFCPIHSLPPFALQKRRPQNMIQRP